jgi:hypothetical protein
MNGKPAETSRHNIGGDFWQAQRYDPGTTLLGDS